MWHSGDYGDDGDYYGGDSYYYEDNSLTNNGVNNGIQTTGDVTINNF